MTPLSKQAPKISLPLDKQEWTPSPLPGQVILVTTIDENGNPNVSTKSWISMAAFGPPPIIMFGCHSDHQTSRNIRQTKEFVINIPPMRLSSMCYDIGTDKHIKGAERFKKHELTMIPAEKVKPPRLQECKAHLECTLEEVREWGTELSIFGKIVAFSMDTAVLEKDHEAAYRKLAPFFFLEHGLTAQLGCPVRPGSHLPNHVLTILAVSNLGRSEKFYKDAFDFSIRVKTPVYIEFELPDGRGLGIYQQENFALNTNKSTIHPNAGEIIGNELYFMVEDLAGAIQNLEKAGAALLAPPAPKPWGDEAAYFSDHDGNVLVVAKAISETP